MNRRDMKVLKFGGTSVGSAESIRNVTKIVEREPGTKIVVVSAMSGVTNALVELHDFVRAENREGAQNVLSEIREKHLLLILQLFDNQKYGEVVGRFENEFSRLESLISLNYRSGMEAEIITFGERFLSLIFSCFLGSQGIQNALLDAKEFMHVDNLENPDSEKVGQLLLEKFSSSPSEVYVTQGFVRLDRNKNISTLKRGGSDFSATIIAAAVNASEVQIWTDIDGFHNNDPRYVEHTEALRELSFEEAAELAYFGAKILHPQTVSPVKEKNIPIYLKNTFTPDAPGTKISSDVKTVGLKAISAKDGITAIKIKSNRMLMAHGFLKKIFEVFDRHETSIDMITTSEIAISLTIDDDQNLPQIVEELQSYGEIAVDQNHSIICVVGEGVINDKGTFRLFEVLNDLPVRMISYGGSNNNISLLVDSRNKIKALKLLNQKLFQEKYEPQI